MFSVGIQHLRSFEEKEQAVGLSGKVNQTGSVDMDYWFTVCP